jgi:hypothetical protein
MGAGAVVVRLPLFVVKPIPASASLIEYGSSFSAFTLRSISICQYMSHRRAFLQDVPPLVHLALLVRQHVGLALKELCALEAVVLPQAGQVFYGLRILELCEVLLVAQVGVDLVEVARMPARLLLAVLSAYGRHGGVLRRFDGCVGLDPRPSAVVVLAGGFGYGPLARAAVQRPADAEEISRNAL